jgi:hypothetical protein
MQPDYQDRRRFQIAVVGSPSSDRVIYLPPEHRSFSEVKFMLGASRCYCGTLLGGCGGELVPTKGTGRVCFLRHLSGSECDLARLREDAADHIFIGRGLLKLRGVGADRPRYEFPELRVGGAVAVRANLTHQIYTHLSNESARRWETTRELEDFRESRVSVLYGEAVRSDFVKPNDRGFALRVRCRTQGNRRTVDIGTQVSLSKIWWAPIRNCRYERGEIQTPYLKRRDGALVPTAYALDEKPARFEASAMPHDPILDHSLVRLRKKYELASS